eukprot:CAMPEP_0198239970 /NCGR_PEP_ID=MMETSP1446-20131203/5232_1 /TAXON_ID=1461542 ORGANISM="Unidentified sp, Strain CCMP2111" /NCGR_SAMPLE_ID=MMETSP1446 /ASSEMBLY_ACC=CAM_ASM_001112 /LENGTH=44 /DNA_ID= /DNA_START= /DNA_END= /DNA_ORIENTATION=
MNANRQKCIADEGEEPLCLAHRESFPLSQPDSVQFLTYVDYPID